MRTLVRHARFPLRCARGAQAAATVASMLLASAGVGAENSAATDPKVLQRFLEYEAHAMQKKVLYAAFETLGPLEAQAGTAIGESNRRSTRWVAAIPSVTVFGHSAIRIGVASDRSGEGGAEVLTAFAGDRIVALSATLSARFSGRGALLPTQPAAWAIAPDLGVPTAARRSHRIKVKNRKGDAMFVTVTAAYPAVSDTSILSCRYQRAAEKAD